MTEPVLNKEQAVFFNTCRQALNDETFKRVVFTGPGKGNDKVQVRFDLVLGETKKLVVLSTNRNQDKRSLDFDVDVLLKLMSSDDVVPFRAAVLSTETFDFHYAENRKGHARTYRAKPSMKGVENNHNRQKNYVLDPTRPYLRGLGVTSQKGVVIKKHYGKFRQIANFIEIIDRDIGEFVSSTDRPITMTDLGCGKGYLTFAAYDYIRERAKHQPQATGIDIKANVIDLCNSISSGVGFSGLRFINGRIQKDKPIEVDILIALHACDTATDDALAHGVRSHMKYFFCAPCCQAEIAVQLTEGASVFQSINNFPLMRRRQADVITDVCRALLLTALGYRVKFLEFTALEHTSKNVMLAGYLDESVDRRKAHTDYLQLKRECGFKRHSLENNLSDLL